MTTATLSPAETSRISIQKDTAPGLPPLPHIPDNLNIKLTSEQQEANLLHVALWIVERDKDNFYMGSWHRVWEDSGFLIQLTSFIGKEAYNQCGTVHCISGFAQVMAGEVGFSIEPWEAGRLLLGDEAEYHFHDDDDEGLAFLEDVIARNS